jgi:Helix-turn-helix domain
MTARRLRRENKPDVKRFLYVPLPVFVGGKSLLAAGTVPQFAVSCHQMPHSCHLPPKMPHSATIRRILQFCELGPFAYFLSAFRGGRSLRFFARKSAPTCLRHFLEVEHRSTLRGEIMVNLITEQEVSKRLNVSVASLRRWRLLGRGPAFLKIGSLVRYRPEDLDRWLASLPTGGSNGPRYSATATGEYG